MINTKLTGLHAQAAALRTIADLTEAAISYGATRVPMWTFFHIGTLEGVLVFEEGLKASEMDAWRLALGVAVEMTHLSYDMESNRYQTDTMHAVLGGQRVRVTATYPCTVEQAAEANL